MPWYGSTDEEETLGDRIHGTYIAIMAASIELDEEISWFRNTFETDHCRSQKNQLCSFGGSMVKPILQSVIICHYETRKKDKKKLWTRKKRKKKKKKKLKELKLGMRQEQESSAQRTRVGRRRRRRRIGKMGLWVQSFFSVFLGTYVGTAGELFTQQILTDGSYAHGLLCVRIPRSTS
jgi:hypothetical protein